MTPPKAHDDEKPPRLGQTVKRLLVTGFEPFGGADVNVSQDVLSALQSKVSAADPWAHLRPSPIDPIEVELERIVLSVDEVGSLHVAKRLQAGDSWDAILHLGVCGTCTVPRLEMRAQDVLDMRIPDNSGRQLQATPLSGQGDVWSTAPIRQWMRGWETAAELSVDAGTYLSNETLYRTLDALPHPSVPVLFLHLPKEEHYELSKSTSLVNEVLARLVHKPVIEVAGALFIQDGEFLLARRAPHEQHPGTWEFPGGKLEQNESFEQAIIREIQEELAWDIKTEPSIGTWHHELDSFCVALSIMPCRFSGETPLLEVNEHWTSHDRVEWFSPSSSTALEWTGSDHLVVKWLVEQNLLA